MPARRSFQLARVFGIRIGVGISWFVVLGLIIALFTPSLHEELGGSTTTAYLVTVAIVLSFFLSLILHELGHALVARRSGVPVMGIELWALGGLTRTGPMTRPGVELRVAGAGPLVTLAIALLCTALGEAIASGHHFLTLAAGGGGVAAPAVVWLGWVASLNALVLIINLLPAFPLDGAQIVHALLWQRTGDRNRATRTVGRLGQGFGVLLGAAGLGALVTLPGISGAMVALMGLFVYQSATAAVFQGAMNQRIQQLTVADVMDPQPVTIPADTGLLAAQEHFFTRYRWPWFAVVDPTHHFLGVVRSQRVDAEIAAGRPALPVSDVLEENLAIRIDEDQSLESLLRSEALSRLGAMVAVDADGVLRGVVTVAQIRQALRPAGV